MMLLAEFPSRLVLAHLLISSPVPLDFHFLHTAWLDIHEAWGTSYKQE